MSCRIFVICRLTTEPDFTRDSDVTSRRRSRATEAFPEPYRGAFSITSVPRSRLRSSTATECRNNVPMRGCRVAAPL